MAGWERYRGGTAVGDVRRLRDVKSPQLGNRRDLLVYLPRTHGEGRALPVIYMQDGENVFDEATSNSGEWRVDETLEELAGEGVEAVVVAVPSAGAQRGHEYAGEGAEDYLAFLVDTVRPIICEDFDVDESRAATGIAGSSLGGLISLHGLYARPEVFGFAGVFSPAFWWNDDRLFDLVEAVPPPPARIYMDVGAQEGEDEWTRAAYIDGFERMEALLRSQGYDDDDLLTVFDRGGIHHESAWARRLPDALRFLLSGRAPTRE